MSVQIEGKAVIEDGNVVKKVKSDMKAKHGRKLGILANQNSRREPQRDTSVGEGKGNHGMVKQHDVEEWEQGRRLGNEKWRD